MTSSADSHMVAGTQGYEEDAHLLLERYESTSFAVKHEPVLQWIPERPTRVLDIGSGSGADAAWLADQGHTVLAVEPVDIFREAAARLHTSPRIEWLADSLPLLRETVARSETFGLIMITAVWMHLDREERQEAMSKVALLLQPDGHLIMSLRHGPVPAKRRMFEVAADETVDLAAQEGLSVMLNVRTESAQLWNRHAGITWSRLVFHK